MSLIGQPDENQVAKAWEAAMQDILSVSDQKNIPELNIYQCGSYDMHSLTEAHEIAQKVLQTGVAVNYNDELMLSEQQLQALQA